MISVKLELLWWISGSFSRSEDYSFHLYPVFADMEGEPMYIIGMPSL